MGKKCWCGYRRVHQFSKILTCHSRSPAGPWSQRVRKAPLPSQGPPRPTPNEAMIEPGNCSSSVGRSTPQILQAKRRPMVPSRHIHLDTECRVPQLRRRVPTCMISIVHSMISLIIRCFIHFRTWKVSTAVLGGPKGSVRSIWAWRWLKTSAVVGAKGSVKEAKKGQTFIEKACVVVENPEDS